MGMFKRAEGLYDKFNGLYVLFAFLGCLGIGTIGYRTIEGWGWLESLYMTVITITTVGFHEENPLSPEGKVFTICLIFIGFGIVVYTLTTATSLIIRGELFTWIRRYLMSARVELFNDHFIVCGYGRMGKVVARQLQISNIPIVIIERNPSFGDELDKIGVPYIIGNSSDESVLQRAAIDKSAGIISVVSSDAENALL